MLDVGGCHHERCQLSEPSCACLLEQSEFNQVQHRELVEVAAPLAVAAEAGADLEDAERPAPDAP
jgi:hypothetical protein